ncbi:MAG TPA: hypothetical protein VNW99_11015 [Cytophagaceae bacterium]|jgi:hypothetical protein|nr:hypothetical protein [Cytophagaceae bacterium]
MKKVNCPFCQGFGSIGSHSSANNAGELPEETYTCTTCDGEGEISIQKLITLRVIFLLAYEYDPTHVETVRERIFENLKTSLDAVFAVTNYSERMNRFEVEDLTEFELHDSKELSIDSFIRQLIKSENLKEEVRTIINPH